MASITQSPVLWLIIAAIFAVILGQSAVYIHAAKRSAEHAGMSQADVRTAIKTGAVSAIGPSLAVCLVAVSLLPIFGTPATLGRIGLIGSAAYDVSSAGLAAQSMNGTLKDAATTPNIFAVTFFTMSLGGAMWILSTLIFTTVLSRGEARLNRSSTSALTVIPTAALLGAFATLTLVEVGKSSLHAVVAVSAAVIMLAFMGAAKALKAKGLVEWGLGLSILGGLAVGYILH